MGTPLNISKDLSLDLESLIGQCVAVLGIRGSGKSNTAGVIFEELLDHNYPMSIVDIEGEYFGLKEQYEVLVVGTGEGVEIEIDAGCAGEIAEVSMEKNVPVVLDLSGFLSDERTEVLKEYLSSLWNLAGRLRRPYIIGIEEAHEFIPQGVKTELKELIARIALRGRKRGLGAIVVSQRSAKVDKDVLSQAGLLLLHRVVHEVDMRVYGELLPWRKSEVKEIISALDTGDCIFVNGDSVLPIYVRERRTFHAGFTPTLEAVATPELKQVSASIIEAIERARGTKARRTRTDELEELVERLEGKLAEKDRKIVELEEVARTLGYIKVELPTGSSSGAPSARTVSEPDFLPHMIGVTRSSGQQGVALVAEAAVGVDREGEIIEIEESARESEDPASLPPAVLRHLDRLVRRMERKDLLHRRLLSFLVGHSPGSYTVDQIAAWTSCAPGLIVDEPPTELLDAGLIERERRSDGVRYRSNLKRFVAEEFSVYQPDIGNGGLHEVAQRLRDRLTVVGVA
jgi:hypothetical protein